MSVSLTLLLFEGTGLEGPSLADQPAMMIVDAGPAVVLVEGGAERWATAGECL